MQANMGGGGANSYDSKNIVFFTLYLFREHMIHRMSFQLLFYWTIGIR